MKDLLRIPIETEMTDIKKEKQTVMTGELITGKILIEEIMMREFMTE